MDLGSPEAIWHLWVEDFMAIVTMDAHGNSLHQQVLEDSRKRLAALKA
jgi:fumarate hydratase class I